MITIGICDDEPQMRKSLRVPLERTLELLGYEYRILEYDSGEALTNSPFATQLDICFLDIEMKALSGMETAKVLRKQGAASILIFVTAYPDYVFQGYEVHAFHYILKPYQEQKIAEVLRSAVKELGLHETQFYTVEQKSQTIKLPLNEILAFQSDRRKIIVRQKDSQLDFYGRLDDIAAELPDFFLRIHNRYLVNLNHVTALSNDGLICGGETFPISRAYRQPVEIAFARSLLK